MIEAQILYGKLKAICQEMGNNLFRNSRSALLARDRSYAVGLLTGDLELAVQIQYDPEHLFALRESTRSMFDYFSYDIAEGDVLLIADPYQGGTQGQTITMAAPYFHDGELMLFPVIRAQMSDMAGEYPGGYHAEAFEVWQESLRLSPIKLYKGGVLQRDVMRFLLANSRVSTLFASDLLAMYACGQAAHQQIQALLKQIRPEMIKEYVSLMFDYNAKRVYKHIQSFSTVSGQGKAVFTAGAAGQVEITVTVRREENELVLDFTGTGSEVAGPYNSPPAMTAAYAVWPVLAPVFEDISINEGTLRAFRVKADEGSLVHPNFPAATAFSGKVTGHFIAQAVSQALKGSFAASDGGSDIHGPGPQAILYEPVGLSPETELLFLTPGFPTAANGWGPPGLNGDRLLVSAEELEMHHGFQLWKREREDEAQGGMIVTMINGQEALQMNVIVPEGEAGSIGCITVGETAYRRSANAVTLQKGDQLVFHYPGARSGESGGTA
ncbi:hydantoinase B/oxoprolinase family protein [Paenibacillus eucommiae]|uniref:N-methylhydantoinase B n=1 Tax=Paenibacillus eucommiae TaxID=1355755 RepID=A0ABS4IXV2_9BACL|nr:hydantoinase B/oxoprolinase family protein [Paenibacillus eucommiae]MBP1991816.1 N-methylhydantoinase B [Paenibacillus eucommiae]